MMCQKVICAIMIVTLGVINIGMSADIPDLAAWWSLDDGAGTTVVDISGNGHDGQTYGDPAWVTGVHGGAMEFDGVDDWVEFPTTSEAQGFPTINGEVTWALWLKTGAVTISTPVIAVGPVGGAHVSGNRSITVEPSGAINLRGNNVGALVGVDTIATVTDNEWHHVAAAIAFETNGTLDTMQIYIDGDLNKGVENNSININQYAGAAGDFVMAFGKRATFYTGLIDDVAVFGRVLSANEILTVMVGLSKELAGGANPADGATDVLRDSDLSWTPGEFAVTHDVYFGTSFEDVNAASVPTASGLDVNSLDMGVLDFGATYYWRVDEVNGAPDRT
ncbi:MAG: LamG domain-containing protein, partial [Phycisphaerae bacterium]|nr:LamG domain-containing protein [Phycisphaerae bacterium]